MRLGAVTLAAGALLAAGCGGNGSTSTSTSAGAGAPAGEVLFARSCGACHRLDAAGTSGTFGSDLDKLRPSRAVVLRAIEGGPGTMPPAILTGNDAQVVAAYVARVAGS